MQLIAEAVEARQKVQVLEEQEKQLRAQVALYTDKYEEFQQTLSKSNEVFQSFKSEMEKVSGVSICSLTFTRVCVCSIEFAHLYCR